MPEIAVGECVEVQGSAQRPYQLKNTGGVFSCSCPAWKNQSRPIDIRTCKHLIQYRGFAAEAARTGSAVAPPSGAPLPKSVPELLLAKSWDGEQDPTDWWLSEKLDGVRAYWDGERFISRQGNPFCAPNWFTVGLPRIPLDGELWIERKAFQRTVSIVRSQNAGEAWRAVRFVVFDAPAVNGSFEQRVMTLGTTISEGLSAYCQALVQTRCRGLKHLHAELARIETVGGEGLMLRQPGSSYERGRSSTLLKIKRFHDAEAVVVEHLAGAGRHRGRLGALLVALPNGTTFSVGTGFSDALRSRPPAIGSTITFRYQELTDGGVPRFPSFVRQRLD